MILYPFKVYSIYLSESEVFLCPFYAYLKDPCSTRFILNVGAVFLQKKRICFENRSSNSHDICENVAILVLFVFLTFTMKFGHVGSVIDGIKIKNHLLNSRKRYRKFNIIFKD